jgi:uncharacterized RDD family membrane protein YckC
MIPEKYLRTGKRVVAQVIDIGLVGLTAISFHMMFPIPAPLFRWTFFWLLIFYSIMFDYYQHGTIGKHIMKIKIISTYKQRPFFLSCFYRNLLKAIFTIFVFDLVLILLLPPRQGFHNILARTEIVDIES